MNVYGIYYLHTRLGSWSMQKNMLQNNVLLLFY